MYNTYTILLSEAQTFNCRITKGNTEQRTIVWLQKIMYTNHRNILEVMPKFCEIYHRQSSTAMVSSKPSKVNWLCIILPNLWRVVLPVLSCHCRGNNLKYCDVILGPFCQTYSFVFGWRQSQWQISQNFDRSVQTCLIFPLTVLSSSVLQRDAALG